MKMPEELRLNEPRKREDWKGYIERTAKEGELKFLRRSQIEPSKTNPRKSFPREAMEELANNIRQRGIVVPLLVRLKAETRSSKEHEQRYELVAGERRWRAAGIAKLEEVWCIVRELTDSEVIELQWIENLQRKDLSALEEAEGFKKLIESKQYTAETLAEKLGKSRSHVFARLRLVTLSGPARKALEEGQIDASMAGLVASVHGAEKQKEFLRDITDKWNPLSFRAAKEQLEEEYQRSLKGAPWPLEDANLVKKAGACAQCPKRSLNVCTDLGCYEAKEAAWGEQVKKEAEAKGQKFLTGEQYGQGHGYVRLDEECYDVAGRKPWRQIIGKLPEDAPVIVAETEDGIKEVMREDVARHMAKENGVKFFSAGGGGGESYRRAQAAARAKSVIEEKVWGAVSTAVVEKVEGAKLGIEFWRLIAVALADGAWADGVDRIAKRRGLSKKFGESRTAMVKAAREFTIGQAIAFVFEVLIMRGIRGAWGLGKAQKAALAMFKVKESKIAAQVKREIKERKQKKAPRGAATGKKKHLFAAAAERRVAKEAKKKEGKKK